MGWTATDEHRTNRRVAAEMPVRFSVLSDKGEREAVQRTKTTNISCQGLAFVSPVSIPITARLDMAVTLPGGQGELKAEATLVRIARELPDDQGYEYGVQFDMDTVSDQEALAAFVRSIDIVPLLELMVKREASDLHLTAFTPPMFRIRRELIPAGERALSPETVEKLVMGVLSPDRRQQFYRNKDVDFPFMIPGVGRWRGNAFFQRGFVEATFHYIDQYIPPIAELGLPDVVRNIALGSGGLVCVTGNARSGKSTTLAAMIGVINHEASKVIITIEDPVEFVHENARSIIKQREVGSDTPSFIEGLNHVLRQDPDVVVIEDVREPETMDMVLRAAESGRMVFAVFPTADAPATIRHMVSFYPPERHPTILHALSGTLRAIISQRLLPRLDGTGLSLAVEVMTMNDSVRGAIWTGKIEQLPNLMLNAPGSLTLDASLRSLLLRGEVDIDMASQVARDPSGLRQSVAERRA